MYTTGTVRTGKEHGGGNISHPSVGEGRNTPLMTRYRGDGQQNGDDAN